MAQRKKLSNREVGLASEANLRSDHAQNTIWGEDVYQAPRAFEAATRVSLTKEEYLRLRRVETEAGIANLAPLPITTQRQPIYGHPALNFARQAIMWSGLLANKLVKPITPQEVALMMAACKIARLVESPTHEDSITDVGGYMSCLEQVNAVVEAGSDGTGIRSETVAQARATATDPT